MSFAALVKGVVYVTTAEGDGWRHVRRGAPIAVRERLIARKEL